MSSPLKYISGVFRRARQKVADIRAENRLRKLLASSGLVRVTRNIFTMEGENFDVVEQVLERFHGGHYLVVVVGSHILRSCPEGVLESVKIDFEHPDSLSDVISACQSMNRWLLADDKNIIVLCADSKQLDKLVTCMLYFKLQKAAGKVKSPANEVKIEKNTLKNREETTSTMKEEEEEEEEKRGASLQISTRTVTSA
mmetsp:Transcript_13968/g.19585  ORF Transcript_13968/g.19585 Transcript_13968/m.19585 type:complete len:198 (+) Transcript_13968:98-691(+)